MNNRGYLRIVEASIAIVIVIGFLVFTYAQQRQASLPDYSETARQILDELAQNTELRQAVLSNDVGPVKDFVSSRINPGFNYEVKICDLEDVCGQDSYIGKDVFAGERVISSVITSDLVTEKKVKLFIWVK